MPYLIINADIYKYKLYHFVGNISIGRDSSNDIVLNSDGNKTISRRHAEILSNGKEFQLIDKSLNGTRIEDELIERHWLRHGDKFQIADYFFTFIGDTSVELADKHRPALKAMPVNAEKDKKTVQVWHFPAIGEDAPDLRLKEELKAAGIIVEDENMLAIYQDLDTVSHINVPILIRGEPGTGKEKVAQTVHAFLKARGEFVAVNCSAIPGNLFESEFFGTAPGAYTGAEDKPGYLEAAQNGTLFLDEIGDMERNCQPKLLRFLETRSMSRLGERRIRYLNLRVVAATNQDLNTMIQKKTFRPDLYQRLACVELNIPPLRERKKDILPLANFFLAKYARQYNLKPLVLSSPASRMMMSHSWPGNVRELSNVMLKAIIFSNGKNVIPAKVLAHLISASQAAGGDSVDDVFPTLSEMVQNHIQKALARANNNKTLAAAILGIARSTVIENIKKYDIKP